AVVAVLPHLRHENAWSTPLVRGELLDLLLGALQFCRSAHLLGVDTGNGPDRTGVPAPYTFQRVGDFTDGRLRTGGIHGEFQQVRVRLGSRREFAQRVLRGIVVTFSPQP